MTTEEVHLINLHYFFSTVPQVLGAILAISGAFVAFNLERMKKELDGNTQTVIDRYRDGRNSNSAYRSVFSTGSYFESFREAQVQRNSDLIINHIDSYRDVVEEGVEEGREGFILVKYHFESIKDQKERIDNLIESTKKTYLLNGFILLLLLAVFFVIPQLYLKPATYWSALGIGFIVTSFSIYNIVKYLINSLYSSNSPKRITIRNMYNWIRNSLRIKK